MKSKLLSVLFIVFFAVLCALTLLAILGLILAGSTGANGQPLVLGVLIVFLIMPWLGLYISISHRMLLNKSAAPIYEAFE